ncbi:uncharacterized protein LOC143362009 [Halictus rubicundus]|uniref:uncharacterized protein LOC143362009 n=1 Tax=Halictus rubicundus TaxID=77578 RepID=UPI004037123D
MFHQQDILSIYIEECLDTKYLSKHCSITVFHFGNRSKNKYIIKLTIKDLLLLRKLRNAVLTYRNVAPGIAANNDMYQGYCIAFFLLCNYLPVLGWNMCNIACNTQGCTAKASGLILGSCTNEDVQTIPNNINFTIKDGESFDYPASLEISFIPPKHECMCTVTLLANESINETECETYDFQNFHHSEVHTSEKTLCFYANTPPNLKISYQYIFTACYAVQFSSFDHEKYIFKKFLKTNYRRTEVAKPQVACTYNSSGDNETEKLDFEVDLSVSLVSELTVGLGWIDNSTGQENCIMFGNPRKREKKWIFNIAEIYNEFNKTSSISVQNSTMYRKIFLIDIKPIGNRNYCVYVNMNDERYKDNSPWKPEYRNCGPKRNETGSHTIDTGIAISNYLYMIVIVTSITLSIILMTLKLVYFIYIRICKKLCITAGKNDKKVNEKSVRLHISKDKDTLTMCPDIVLLYPKGSESFMSLMAEFREILSTACQCSVHDWYNATECNYVAEIGGSDWFAELLNKGCRIIWIDTPASRSLIAKKFKSSFFVNDLEEYKFDEICDFRDIVLTTIFDLAKRNLEQSIQQQHKHFIVRLKGFESSENENDPFLSLYPDTRYIIPQDLNLLCSNLSLLESNVIIPFISGEDKFIEHHLYCTENDFCK